MAGIVWVVIVNYRTVDLAVNCLRSVAPQIAELPGSHAVAVDNASCDGSVQTLTEAILREGWQDCVSVLPLDRNGGFAYGNNTALRQALRAAPPPDYLLLLNPDTFVHRGAVRALVEFMRSHPRAGIAGSCLEDAEGNAQSSAHYAPSPLGEFVSGARLGMLSRALPQHGVAPASRTAAHACDWVSGASFMVRREVFADIGLLDEGYFLYFEEVDFCSRARKAGWEVWFVPESRVMHLEGASTAIRNTAQRRPRYWYESRRRYFVKHFGVPGLLAADACWATGRASFALRRVLRLASANDEGEPRGFARDLLWGDLRSLLSGKLWD